MADSGAGRALSEIATSSVSVSATAPLVRSHGVPLSRA
jgi:hypothetical protein